MFHLKIVMIVVLTLCFSSRSACAATRGFFCLHTEGAFGGLCWDWCLELPLPDSSLEVCPSSGLWYKTLLVVIFAYVYIQYNYYVYTKL